MTTDEDFDCPDCECRAGWSSAVMVAAIWLCVLGIAGFLVLGLPTQVWLERTRDLVWFLIVIIIGASYTSAQVLNRDIE